jgi:hypothetical protein
MHRSVRSIAIGLVSATLLTASLGGLNPVSASEGLIGGSIFHDLDRDGIWDAGERSLAGTVVCLHRHDWCDHTEAGHYMFDLLEPGRYLVKLVDYPDGFRPTTPRAVRIVLGQDQIRSDVHFGLATVP